MPFIAAEATRQTLVDRAKSRLAIPARLYELAELDVLYDADQLPCGR